MEQLCSCKITTDVSLTIDLNDSQYYDSGVYEEEEELTALASCDFSSDTNYMDKLFSLLDFNDNTCLRSTPVSEPSCSQAAQGVRDAAYALLQLLPTDDRVTRALVTMCSTTPVAMVTPFSFATAPATTSATFSFGAALATGPPFCFGTSSSVPLTTPLNVSLEAFFRPKNASTGELSPATLCYHLDGLRELLLPVIQVFSIWVYVNN